MGVKDVWHETGPCEERISLNSLRGSTLAIDLAGWVVQNNAAPGMSFNVTRPHLRNLFFRLNTLLSLDILPVVVLDGTCPVAKSATVQARNAATWGSKVPGIPDSPKRQQRRQFSGVLRDCQSLVKSLGVPCVTAPGEAEAFCSALNGAGLVDAVISDDSDCFCYGAKTVLRHFSTDPKNFSVSQYSAKRIRNELGLSRQRLVIMALILGCDYNPGGVSGVGREALMKLFHLWGSPNKTELETVLSWQDTGVEEVNLSKPIHCGTCGHPGSVGSHRKAGCSVCGTAECGPGIPCKCDYHSPEFQLKMAEWTVKKKAVASPGWPFKTVVDEFYRAFGKMPAKFCWNSPRPCDFTNFAIKKMDWLKEYCIEKIMETVVRWQVRNPDQLTLVAPKQIVKKRIKAGENLFEVQWNSQDGFLPDVLVACVPSTEFSESFPIIYKEYEDFLEEKERGKKKSKKKGKENKMPKATAKSKTKNQQQPTLDAFLEKQVPCVEESETKNLSIKKPSTVVFKKIISSDPKFNNVIVSKKLVTPQSSILSVVKTPPLLDQSDSFMINFKNSHSIAIADSSMADSLALSDSMRQYMEDDNDSDLSAIIDDIVGNKKSDPMSEMVEKMSEISIHVSSSTPSNIPKHLQTSTPYSGCSSPLLKKAQYNLAQIKKSTAQYKASDVFDISDSFLVEEVCDVASAQISVETESLEDLAKEETFDEFDCLDNPSITPFAERVKKKFK